MAFSVLSLSAKKEWNADNVPIPFLQDSTQYVSDPDGYVDRALKDSANFYLQKLKLECGVQNVLIIVGRVANQDAFRMAQDVGNKYGIGYKKSRRGLVIVIAVEDHCGVPQSSASKQTKSTPTFSVVSDCRARAISSITATPLAPSLAAITGLRQLVESGSLSAQGRLSQWAQRRMRVVTSGRNRAMMLREWSVVPSHPFTSAS